MTLMLMHDQYIFHKSTHVQNAGMEAITVIADWRFYQMRILNAVSFNYSFYFSSVQITGSGSKQMEQDSSDTKRLFLLMSHLIHFNKD